MLLNFDFELTVNPTTCYSSAAASDAYHVQLQVGKLDDGMILHLDDFNIEGTCTDVASIYTVEYIYGTLTTDEQNHVDDDDSTQFEFEFVSYDQCRFDVLPDSGNQNVPLSKLTEEKSNL